MRIIKRKYEEAYYEGPLTREAPNSQRNRTRLAALLKHQPAGRLLEVGCGKGGFLSLAEKHYEVEGIDISQYAINRLKPHFGDRVNVYNIEQRPLRAGEYDVVAAFNVLEHLQQPNKAVEKISDALTNNGVLFGSVPNNYGLVGGAATLISNFFDRTHLSTFTPDTWERIFRCAGFTRIHFFGEVTVGPNICRYVYGRYWQHRSFNLMFFCDKF